MKRQRRHLTATVSVNSDLERRWQEALRDRPDENNPTARAAWDRKHGDLLAEYQAAVEQAKKRLKEEREAKSRRRRWMVAAVIAVVLVVSGIVYWVNQPSEDEIRMAQLDRKAAACDTHYTQARRVKLVSTQVDLLQDGEGGWLELRLHGEPAPVGGVTLSPAELLNGKTGKAQVNHEAYVRASSRYVGPWALVERQEGRLTVTLFSSLSGFGELPHNPLPTSTASAATVRGEKVTQQCF